MSNVQRSSRLIAGRKRKMMLVLPLLVIPFLTMAFWALGGGQGKEQATIVKQQGLNLNLPDAKMKDENLTDKLSFYDKADKDSAKLEEWMRTDPYYKQNEDTSFLPSNELEFITQNSASKYNQRLNSSPYETSSNNPEDKLLKKLALLQKEINNQPESKIAGNNEVSYPNQSDEFSNEVDRLENMMLTMDNTNTGDPEMQQLNGTLEKILDIQHPERIKEKLKKQTKQTDESVFAVSREKRTAGISLLDTSRNRPFQHTGFFGIENNMASAEENAIEAVIHQTQVLVNGSIIKLRLITDIHINGNIIPKGNFISGIVSLNNERLTVEISSVRNNQSIFPVKLEVFDMDGLPGIYIPGAISRDVAKQSADNSLQLMELSSMDPSFKAQAAAAGITAAKSLISKKVKQVKVIVKAGYKVLLKDKNNQQ